MPQSRCKCPTDAERIVLAAINASVSNLMLYIMAEHANKKIKH